MKPARGWAVVDDRGKLYRKFRVGGGWVYCDTPTEFTIYGTREQAKRHGPAGKLVRVRITPVKKWTRLQRPRSKG